MLSTMLIWNKILNDVKNYSTTKAKQPTNRLRVYEDLSKSYLNHLDFLQISLMTEIFSGQIDKGQIELRILFFAAFHHQEFIKLITIEDCFLLNKKQNKTSFHLRTVMCFQPAVSNFVFYRNQFVFQKQINPL